MTSKSASKRRPAKATSTNGSALARLVRGARGSTSQETFAAQLGVSQESLSRYERGRIRPPAEVVAKCWEAFEDRSDAVPPAAEELAERVRGVSGAEFVALREAIARLIDISVGRALSGRRPRQGIGPSLRTRRRR